VNDYVGKSDVVLASALKPEMTTPAVPLESGEGSPTLPWRWSWTGLAGYLALLVGGIGIFLVVRSIGEGLVAPPAPADATPIGSPKAG
jgi:hypothetical protein